MGEHRAARAGRTAGRRLERQRAPQVNVARGTGDHGAGSAGRTALAGGALIGPGSLLGLASGISWGAGDFAGGLIGRYSSALLAVVVSQSVGLAGTAVLLLVSGEAMPAQSSVLWAAAAGASGVIGLGCFYYALSRGTMGVIAPLTAVIGAGVPVFLDLFGGADVPLVRLVGIGVALLAVVLISLPPRSPAPGTEQRLVRLDLAELPLVVLSGLGFAGFFIFIDQASADGAVWWPLAVVRVVGLIAVVGAFLAIVSRRSGGSTYRDRSTHALGLDRLRATPLSAAVLIVVVAAAGIGDLGGNAFFVLATQAGDFAVTVILASLYPVVTTVLAAIFLHERLRAVQILGVVLATVSVVLLR